MTEVRVIDSHTGGEPTRVVLSGGPDLGGGTMAERLIVFRDKHDGFRRGIIREPRGAEVLVGALLTTPVDPTNAAGVLFFNNVGYLGMCGHGTIGLIETLAHLGQIGPGKHRIETPVGVVTACLNQDKTVSVENVPAYRLAKAVSVGVPGIGEITGDIAWGGNWFFLVSHHGQEVTFERVGELTAAALQIKAALIAQNITGESGAEIDHIELFAPPDKSGVDSKNFVLCPGGAYDRSPCGTGTSAKVACLVADGLLQEGEVWKQESIVGSVFTATFRLDGDTLLPTICGRAFVTGDTTLLFSPDDPFREGIS